MPVSSLLKFRYIDYETQELYNQEEIISDSTLPGVVLFRKAQSFYIKYFGLDIWENEGLKLSHFIDHKDWDLDDRKC